MGISDIKDEDKKMVRGSSIIDDLQRHSCMECVTAEFFKDGRRCGRAYADSIEPDRLYKTYETGRCSGSGVSYTTILIWDDSEQTK